MGKGSAVDCNFLNLSLIISLCFGTVIFYLGFFLTSRLVYEDNKSDSSPAGAILAGTHALNAEKITAAIIANGGVAPKDKAFPTAWYILGVSTTLAGLVQAVICGVALKLNKLSINIIMGVHGVPVVLCAMGIVAYVSQDWKLPMFPGWIITLSVFDMIAIFVFIVLKFAVFKK